MLRVLREKEQLKNVKIGQSNGQRLAFLELLTEPKNALNVKNSVLCSLTCGVCSAAAQAAFEFVKAGFLLRDIFSWNDY